MLYQHALAHTSELCLSMLALAVQLHHTPGALSRLTGQPLLLRLLPLLLPLLLAALLLLQLATAGAA
jgi:hypothetical protein